MSIPGFGVPASHTGHDNGGSPDDEFAGMGLPSADSGGPSLSAPVGVFAARCTGVKTITAKGDGTRYLVMEFELVDPDFDGEEYSLMAPAISADDSRSEAKKKQAKWMRIGQAVKALGLAIDPRTQLPLDGWAACEGLPCRLAVSTYDKAGVDQPTIVLGVPKGRQRDGVEVGFPREFADDRGKFRDYGCGVLPPE